MPRTRGQTGLWSAAVALLFCAWVTGEVRADPILQNVGYSTSGTISSNGVNGPSALSFQGVTHGAFDVPGTFSLGDFQVQNPSSSQVVTYANTPFNISFLSNRSVPIVLSGVLNGTVSGSDQSSLVATFQNIHYDVPILNTSAVTAKSIADPSSNFPVQANPSLGLQLNGLSQGLVFSLVNPTPTLGPSSSNGGMTTAMGQIQLTGSVPEPAPIALFVAALTGLGLKRRRRCMR